MELKEKLVNLRKKNGLSQAELAEAINVSRQAISRWEVGSAIPSADNLMWLSKFYKVSMDELMDTSCDDEQDIPGEITCTSDKLVLTNSGKTEKKLAKRAIIIGCFLFAVAMLWVCIVGTWPKQDIGITTIGEMKVEDDTESPVVGVFSIEW